MKDRKNHILIVDDNEMNRELLSRRLKRNDYSISTATNGRETLELVETQNFDLILLDIMMPEINGMEVLRIIRQSHSMTELPIIMVTAKGLSDDVVKAFEFGANDYLMKPIDFPVMLARIQTQMRLKQLEEMLKKARDEAINASYAKSEFLASMSHEIRTPMNSIIGMADVLIDSDLSNEQKNHVALIQKAGDTLLTLINDILDVSKIEAGHLKLENIEFDLVKVVEETIAMMKIRTDVKSLDLSTNVSSEVTNVYYGDSCRLKQILINLIGNSVKFTAFGEIVVNIKLNNECHGKTEILFSVSDTGIGIPFEKKTHIFEKFSQADSSTTRKYGGTGLGLAISKKLVEMMGGQIWVESEINIGTTFYFTIKVEKLRIPVTNDMNSNPKDPTQVNFPKSIHKTKNASILLVDDFEDNRLVVQTYLRKTNHKIEIAENGQIAVNKFKMGKFDLVLMDVQMPIMDGYTATEEIRKYEKENNIEPTPIIALTANAMTEDLQKSLDAGCDAHFTKPIRKIKLFDLLKNYICIEPVEDLIKNTTIENKKHVINIDQEFEDLAPIYLDNRRTDVNTILTNLELSDFDAIKSAGHKMKGSGGAYGFEFISDIGRKLEEKAGLMDSNSIRQSVLELSEYIENVELHFVKES